jgi:LysM repeat protein
MSKRIFLLALFALPVMLNSCRTSKPVVASSYPTANDQEYIQYYQTLAISEMKRTGVPASITMAQALIESDAGRSRLAREANNHFGIKCHDDWSGPTVRHNDDRRNECFRKYSKPEGSFKDHSDFLRKEPRYKSLFSLDPEDYKAWARGLKKAGYATNPDYANLLIRKIEQYNLYKLDDGNAKVKKPVRPDEVENNVNEPETAVQAKPAKSDDNGNFTVTAVPSRVKENNRIQYIVVKEGETKESIEKEFQMLGWELARYNELPSGFNVTAGQLLYLQPKRDRAEAGKEFHTVKEGETIYSISQLYGIKLKSLITLNRMEQGVEPVAGQKIWLRSQKPIE